MHVNVSTDVLTTLQTVIAGQLAAVSCGGWGPTSTKAMIMRITTDTDCLQLTATANPTTLAYTAAENPSTCTAVQPCKTA